MTRPNTEASWFRVLCEGKAPSGPIRRTRKEAIDAWFKGAERAGWYNHVTGDNNTRHIFKALACGTTRRAVEAADISGIDGGLVGTGAWWLEDLHGPAHNDEDED